MDKSERQKSKVSLARWCVGVLLLWCAILSNSCALAQEEGAGHMKRAVMIIAEDNFRDEELSQPSEVLKQNNIEVTIASTALRELTGMLQSKVKPDILISDIRAKDYDAIVFVGGSGASQYWDDPLAHKLAKEAYGSNKVVAAICIAPVTLARSGILKGRKATVWSSEANQLKLSGANYTGNPVEKDANIITASGPSAAREFGEAIVAALR